MCFSEFELRGVVLFLFGFLVWGLVVVFFFFAVLNMKK